MRRAATPPVKVSIEEALEHLVESSKAILSELETDRLLEVLMDRAIDLTRADRGFLMLADDDGRLSTRAARRGGADDDDAELLISRSVAEEVFRTGRAILSTNVAGDDAVNNRRSVLELRLKTVMCAPLIAQDRRLGVLYVDSSHLRSTFGKSSLAVFQGLADLAAIALENARLYHLASTDPKTTLANSSCLETRLRKELHGGSGAVGLILVDLDHFKRINDNHGHPAGDRVLIAVAQVLRACVRHRDLAARFGGEEFALLLTSDLGEGLDCVAIAERARSTIAQLRVDLPGADPIRVTASLGVATSGELTTASADRLVALADRRLYAAKNAGRNQVIAAEPAPATCV